MQKSLQNGIIWQRIYVNHKGRESPWQISIRNYRPDDKKKEPKIGKDYPILILIGLTIFVCFLGWGNFDNMNRAMYVLLTVSLILTYVRRHAKLSETRAIYVERASAASIGLAIALFFIVLYYQFFG